MAVIRTAPAEPAGFVTISRALVSAAADLVTGVQRRVVGDDKVRTARDNAWAATLEDRARHEARAELTREVAALVARRRADRQRADRRLVDAR
ncbi:hypothetical protein [Actinoplanes sp. M2I2]|uniref:hypothetical protein n=1 Tax=Actinoplanes sp. M2I2 TaxID=1734444 RepID=UPI0020218145|nr:hypothetical protein [Actinoplanes sp. M2I2]